MMLNITNTIFFDQNVNVTRVPFGVGQWAGDRPRIKPPKREDVIPNLPAIAGTTLLMARRRLTRLRKEIRDEAVNSVDRNIT